MNKKLDKLSAEVDALLTKAFDKAKKKGCSIKGCKEPVTGIGEDKQYCQAHFWEEFDKRYPED
jgi:hypothetical protein